MNYTQVVANLERLIRAVEAHPEEGFGLDSFKDEVKDELGNVCGTLFCTAGLACTLPEFQAVGFELKTRGDYYVSYYVEVNGENIIKAEGTDATFGEHAFDRLFSARADGTFDEDHAGAICEREEYNDILTIEEAVTDKELALWRLNKQLTIYREKINEGI